MELTPEAKELLAQEGYDPTFGARPLRRSVQRLIENPLSEELLKGTIESGVTVLAKNEAGQIVFETIR